MYFFAVVLNCCVARGYEVKNVVKNHEHSSTFFSWHMFLNINWLIDWLIDRIEFYAVSAILQTSLMRRTYPQLTNAWPTELLQSIPTLHHESKVIICFIIFNEFANVAFWVVNGFYKIAFVARKWFIFFHRMSFSCSLCFNGRLFRLYWKRIFCWFPNFNNILSTIRFPVKSIFAEAVYTCATRVPFYQLSIDVTCVCMQRECSVPLIGFLFCFYINPFSIIVFLCDYVVLDFSVRLKCPCKKIHCILNKRPAGLMVTRVSETLHWFLAIGAYICLSTAPL